VLLRAIFCFAVAAALSVCDKAPTQAALLVDPIVGGTLIWDGSQDLNGSGEYNFDPVMQINTGSTFKGKFYGRAVGPVFVSENGNLLFSSPADFFPVGLNEVRGSIIAPLWDDFLVLPGANNAVIDHSVGGQYLGLTWSNVRLELETSFDPDAPVSFPDTTRSAQVLWFEAATTIRGVTFEPDDIVFSYVGHVVGTADFGLQLFATIGIADSSTSFTPLPGDMDGSITAGESGLLAWESNSYLLFRPEILQAGGTGYVASKNYFTAVPEPSAGLMLGFVGSLAGCWHLIRRWTLMQAFA